MIVNLHGRSSDGQMGTTSVKHSVIKSVSKRTIPSGKEKKIGRTGFPFCRLTFFSFINWFLKSPFKEGRDRVLKEPFRIASDILFRKCVLWSEDVWALKETRG